MNDDERPTVVLCSPVDVVPAVMGCVRMLCTDCARLVWVAPSTFGVPGPRIIVCVQCGEQRIADDDDPEFLGATDEQRHELRRFWNNWHTKGTDE